MTTDDLHDRRDQARAALTNNQPVRALELFTTLAADAGSEVGLVDEFTIGVRLDALQASRVLGDWVRIATDAPGLTDLVDLAMSSDLRSRFAVRRLHLDSLVALKRWDEAAAIGDETVQFGIDARGRYDNLTILARHAYATAAAGIGDWATVAAVVDDLASDLRRPDLADHPVARSVQTLQLRAVSALNEPHRH